MAPEQNTLRTKEEVNEAPVRTLVIEDDPVWRDIVIQMIDQLTGLQLVHVTSDPKEGLKWLDKGNIDMLILDIGLPGITGFELLEQARRPPVVVVTTGDQENALLGFEKGVTDLLLKPYRFDRFMLAIHRGYEQLEVYRQKVTENARTADQSVIGIRSGRRMIRVSRGSIRFIEARGNNMRFHLDDRTLDAGCTMKQLLALLPGEGFTRVHRSYIIADKIVKDLDRETLFTTEGEIPIGGTYHKEVHSRFMHLLSASDGEM